MSDDKKHGTKGYEFEENLRKFFLNSGYYVVRGIDYHVDDAHLTDVDLWLYDRPTVSSRRRAIVDAKNKKSPKTAERLVWTHGLKAALDVDDAYVATTDSRPILKKVARRLKLNLLDGQDTKRIAASKSVIELQRLSEEDLIEGIQKADEHYGNKKLQQEYNLLKTILLDLTPGSCVRALGVFKIFAQSAVDFQKQSHFAELSVRLAYIAASVIAICFDYMGAEVALHGPDDRTKYFVRIIRFGSVEGDDVPHLGIAKRLLKENLENGNALATRLDQSINALLDKIPANIIADYIGPVATGDRLFNIARNLDAIAFGATPLGYDQLPRDEISWVGVLLDFHGIERKQFASAFGPPRLHPKEDTSLSLQKFMAAVEEEVKNKGQSSQFDFLLGKDVKR